MHIFQSERFFKVLENTSGIVPFNVNIKNKYGSGYIQGYIIKEKGFLKSYLSRRAIVIGNPLIENESPNLLANLLRKLKHELTNRAIYLEIRNLSDQQKLVTEYQKQGFIYEDHLDYVFDFDHAEDILWKKIEPAKRNKIRKAMKQNFIFRISDLTEDMKKCYIILKKLYKSINLPLFSEEYFLNLINELRLSNSVKIFIIEKEDIIVAFRLCLCEKDSIYDYYAAADLNMYKLNPNDLLPWEIFKWAKSNGYKHYAFGGAGKPGIPYGVREFKKQYGGKLVNYGRFKLILNKPLYRIGEIGVKMLKKFG